MSITQQNVTIFENGTIQIKDYGVNNGTSFVPTISLHPVGNTVTMSVEFSSVCGCKNMETCLNEEVSITLQTVINEQYENWVNVVYDCVFKLFEQYKHKISKQSPLISRGDTQVEADSVTLTAIDGSETTVGFYVDTQVVTQEASTWNRIPLVSCESVFFLVRPFSQSMGKIEIDVSKSIVIDKVKFYITTDGNISLQLTTYIPTNNLHPVDIVIPSRNYSSTLIKDIYTQLYRNMRNHEDDRFTTQLSALLFASTDTTRTIDVELAGDDYEQDGSVWIGTYTLSKTKDFLSTDITILNLEASLKPYISGTNGLVESYKQKDFVIHKTQITAFSNKSIIAERKTKLTETFDRLRGNLVSGTGIYYPATLFPYFMMEHGRMYTTVLLNMDTNGIGGVDYNWPIQQIFNDYQALSTTLEYFSRLMRYNIPKFEEETSRSFQTNDGTHYYLQMPRF